MLPDFPKVKKSLGEFLVQKANEVIKNSSPILSQIRTSQIFEGDQHLLVRDDNSEEETDFKHLEEKLVLSHKEIENASLKVIFEKILGMLGNLSKQQHALIFSKLEEVTESTGNVVKTKGINPEAVLEMLEKIQIDFDSNGNPNWPTIFSHPAQKDTWKDLLKELEKEPYIKRVEEILKKQKESWYARESLRRLVD